MQLFLSETHMQGAGRNKGSLAGETMEGGRMKSTGWLRRMLNMSRELVQQSLGSNIMTLSRR